MDAPETRYARRDGLHIGYQVWGDGPVDVLELNSGLMISIDETSEEPNWLRYEERLAGFCRLIRFDALGLGLSDPFPTGVGPSIEGWAEDALAVMDDAGSERAVVIGPSGGSLPAVWLAAHHPGRVASLVLINGTARILWDEDYPIGVTGDVLADIPSNVDGPHLVDGVPRDISIYVPSMAQRVGFAEWWGRAARRGASPATAIAWNLALFSADMREHLGAVSCPTLVLSNTDTFAELVVHGRYLSDAIADARFVTLPGQDMIPWAGEFESLVDDIEEFVTGGRAGQRTERVLATVLFTDIVDSTERAAAVGDRRWRTTLDEFDVNVQRLLARHDGVHVKNTGDGMLARFARPAEGVRCAVAMVEAARNSGLDIRAGLHAGEVELRGDDIGGLAVHIASRVSDLAGPGEVLTTSTVRDLVVGSGIAFGDRGLHTLKGVPLEWQLLAVETA